MIEPIVAKANLRKYMNHHSLHRFAFLMAFAGVGVGAATNISAQEKIPAGASIVRIEAQPASLELKTPYDYCQLLLTGQLASGERIERHAPCQD